MALYEHVFLARQDLSQTQIDELVENYTNVIQEAGGQVTKTESWGLKSLAYRMDKNRKAYYTLMNVDAPASAMQEVERQQRLAEEILRSLTIKVEAHEEGQSAMLRKDDRGDRRGGRGGRGGDRGDRGGDRGDRGGDRGDRGDRPRRDRD